MSVTIAEFKHNLGKYLMLSETEDIFITKNGKIIAKLRMVVAWRNASILFKYFTGIISIAESR